MILKNTDRKKEFYLTIDALNYVIRAVLNKLDDNDKKICCKLKKSQYLQILSL
jgi:hypothetical protein